MRTLLIVSFLIFLGVVTGSAQNTASISGQVTRSSSANVAQGVAGISMILERVGGDAARLETVGDAKGNFAFTNLPAGEYLLTAICPPCTGGKVSRAVVLDGRSSVEVNLDLLRSIGQETVTVSSDGLQLWSEVSKSVSTIGGQEMRDRADFSLPDTVRTIPGFRVQQFGGFGKAAVIKSRGLRNHDTAVLLDGVRVRDVSSINGDAAAFLSDITLTSVSKIEVLRGPGSALYGTNSIGGTIDFQTPEPKAGWNGQLSSAFGGLGLSRFRGNIGNGTEDGRFGFVSGISRTDYRRGIDGNDDAANTNFHTRVEFNPNDRTNISMRFFMSDAKVKLNANPDTLGSIPQTGVIDARPFVNFVPDPEDADSMQKSRFLLGRFGITRVVNESLILRADYSFVKTKRRNDDGLLGPGFQSEYTSIYKGDADTFSVRGEWTPSRVHTLRFGYEFEKETFGNDGSTPSGFSDYTTKADQSSGTFFVQDLVSLMGGRLQLAGSARLQTFSLGKPTFSLSSAPYSEIAGLKPEKTFVLDGSASYFIAITGTKIRAHVGNGYRVASLYERFGTFFSTFPTQSFIALGDPELGSEKTWGADAGIDQNLAKGKVRLSATYFYNSLTDTIAYGYSIRAIPGVSRPFGGYYNTKGGISRGAELSAELKPTLSTTIFTSYTFTNSVDRVPRIAASGTNAALGVPRQGFSAVVNQRIGRVWVNADFVASGTYLAPIFSNTFFNSYLYRFGGIRRMDLTTGYNFKMSRDSMTLRVFGTVENLFDHTYYENGFLTPGRNGRIGVSFGF
jgi:vitamin B12 transporter